ncbi:PMS1 protein-like 1, partial [Silurus meridionalis]
MKALPPDTVRLLSSSQVITSVVNVVKELIENSLDAGSSNLEIKLENYGMDRIEVRDNGSGIKAADAPVMAVKHYTSKISCHEDLQHLQTYGFRGEALGSLCTVSEVIITTKTVEDEVSTQYTLDLKGGVVSQRPSHLGQDQHIDSVFAHQTVHYGQTSPCLGPLVCPKSCGLFYVLFREKKLSPGIFPKQTILVVVWQKSKVSDHASALMAVLGSSVAANLLPVRHRHEQAEISIEGYFPKPNSDLNMMSSSTSDKMFIYVNNRPVNHKDILKLVKQYYANSAHSNNESAGRRFPIMMLNITVPGSSVDVNLTPDKLQVMLENKDAVLLAVESVLISLYGSYSVGNESHESAEQSHSVVELTKEPEKVQEKDAPQSSVVSTPLVLGNATPIKKDSETSLPGTANTSSSSSSEDWIINTSLSDSSFSENVGLNSTIPPEDKQESCTEEISAESWTMGKAFTDPTTGDRLEPVKLHQPGAQNDVDLDPEVGTKSSNPCKRATNVIVAKTAKLTAYDLISSRSVRQPLSAFALFEQDTRSSVLLEKPRASLQDVTAAVKERWESLGEEERKNTTLYFMLEAVNRIHNCCSFHLRYEEKAQKSLESYNEQKKHASSGVTFDRQHQKADSLFNKPQGVKRKAPESDQQTLDKLFTSQPERKKKPTDGSKCLQFSMDTLRQALQPERRIGPSEQNLRLVNRLPSHCAWVVSCGRKLMLLNPFRVEEALLFKRLLENNILPAANLQTPIRLTHGYVLGGPEYMDVLMNMEKGSPSFTGEVLFTDVRLVANGFQIRLTPGSSSTETGVEVTAMADCMPFYGIADLREILTAVKDRNAQTLQQCRPLKVSNYLEGEAVRMTRQLPLNMSRDDVTNIMSRMTEEFEGKRDVCLHGRPFFHDLTEVPETDQDA